MVIEFCDAAGSRLAGAPHDRLEVSERICFRRVLRHLIAQAPIDFGGGFAEHIASDVRINVQRCSRRHMAQHGGECLDVHAVFQCHGGESMAQIMKSDLLAPGPLQNDMESTEHGARCERHIQILRRGEQPALVLLLLH